MKIQKLYSHVRRAIEDYHMIEKDDKIAVAVSGGKDSITLLYALAGIKKFYPQKFDLYAVTVDLGFNNVNFNQIHSICDSLGIEYIIVKTDIGKIIFDERKENNPCSLCSKLRKGAINNVLKEKGINKIAYGHHKDDVVVTMLLSLIFEGRFQTFSPVTFLDRTRITVIRPLIYMNESDIIGFINKQGIPVLKSPCPADGNTKRKYIEDLLTKLNRENPGVKERMFSAIKNSSMKGWNIIDKFKLS